MRSKFQLFLFLLAILATLASGSDQNNSTILPTIAVKHATLVGFSNHGLDFFLGIPFAQPPVNALRFAPPKPISEQLGVVNASSEGKSCYRLEHTLTLQGSEDCLHLDVVRPSCASHLDVYDGSLLPVMVFMHGGDVSRACPYFTSLTELQSFDGGDKASYPGNDLVNASIQLEAPIIYVSINYRVNFLGFPSGKEAQAHGALNLGLLDQRLALQWVQENIRAFGGDQEKVLLAGSSSGADAVAYHMLAYGGTTNNLFRAALLESGSATAETPIPYPNYTVWQSEYNNIVNQTGCVNATDTFLCLKTVPIIDLITAIFNTWIASGFINPALAFSPVIDGHFLQEYPSVQLAAKKFASIPMMIGTTTDEYTILIPTNFDIATDEELLGLFEENYVYVPETTLEDLMNLFPLSANLNNGPPGSGIEWSRTVNIVNNLQMFCSSWEQALAVSESSPVWKYRWNAVSEALPSPNYLGVPHESELPYLLGPTYISSPPPNMTSADLSLTTQFQRKVISFIHHLDPNVLQASTPDAFWPRFNGSSEIRLVFQRPDEHETGLFTEVDSVNKTICNWISSKNLEWLR